MPRQESWQRERWQRSDGAVVKYDDEFTFSNPMNPNSRMYTAWEPDPGDMYLAMRSKRGVSFKRRYKTALAAMLAADREWPLGRLLTATPPPA